MYEIVSIPSKHLIELKLRGFWTPETLSAFEAELRAHVRRAAAAQGVYICLCDARDLSIQSKDVAEAYAKFLTEPGVAATRTAILASSPLLKLQVQRIASSPAFEFFDETDEALIWLFGQDNRDIAREANKLG